MKQYTENQYDDDLTVGTDEYDDSYHAGADDLFDLSTDEDSPISRLKSLILSIDWEITDDLLMQFNEELLDLRDIWAGEKLNLVYVQALQKISKYIYNKKADSHPSAIKLLLTLYHNLEQIVSSQELTEEQKKEILLEDVKRFEHLKVQISRVSQKPDESEPPPVAEQKQVVTDEVDEDELLNLKAIVLGIDWEITDQDLNDLRQEVLRLEEKFANKKPKLILLQGIGTLGAYIKLKKSDAHADAFKVLHLFYESLEKIVRTPMSLEEEKAVLLPAVETFNSFKTLLGPTISPEAMSRKLEDSSTEPEAGTAKKSTSTAPSGGIMPAFAELSEDETTGFQAEVEAKTLELDETSNVGTHVDQFFMNNSPAQLSALGSAEDDAGTPSEVEMFGSDDEFVAPTIDREVALAGVDVEEDDEEEPEEVGLEKREQVIPALSGESDELDEQPPAVLTEPSPAAEEALEIPAEATNDYGTLDRDVALQGVSVETEADDESDEQALPRLDGELAPALAENDEVSLYNEKSLETSIENSRTEDDISGRLDGFFEEQIDQSLPGLDGAEVVADEEEISAPVVEKDLDLFAQIDSAEEDEPEAFLAEAALEDTSPQAEDEVEEVVEPEIVDKTPKSRLYPSLKIPTIKTKKKVAEQPVEEEITTKLDTKLEDFFDLGDDETGAVENETISEVDPIGVLDISATDALESTEEEVVFELVDEDEQLADSGEGVVALAEDAAERTTGEMLESMRINIESLGVELDDNIIKGVRQEIENLRQKWDAKPIEKTFLSLLETVTQHIDTFRFDSDDDSFAMLQSVFKSMSQCTDVESQDNQEMLFKETSKVLQWQQKMVKK